MSDLHERCCNLIDWIDSDKNNIPEFIKMAIEIFPEGHGQALLAYNGSLNAALALHKSILSDLVVKTETWSMRHGGTVELSIDGLHVGIGFDANGNPARAWLSAILMAMSRFDDD